MVPAATIPSVAVYREAIRTSSDASLDALLASHADHLLPKTPLQELRDLRSEMF